MRGGRVRTIFEVTSTLAMLLAAGLLVWQNWPKPARSTGASAPRTPAKPISIGPAPIRGALTARVAMMVFSEFECPFCGAVARGALKGLEESYLATGRVRLAFKHFPLGSHKAARGAGAVAICAGEQQKFWEMHDLLFQRQKELTDVTFRNLASELNLKLDRFDDCVKSPATTETIDRDTAEGQALGVRGTPTFYFGITQNDGLLQVTDVLVGARPVGDFAKVLDRLLTKSAGQ